MILPTIFHYLSCLTYINFMIHTVLSFIDTPHTHLT